MKIPAPSASHLYASSVERDGEARARPQTKRGRDNDVIPPSFLGKGQNSARDNEGYSPSSS
jgi:hypothetical protein